MRGLSVDAIDEGVWCKRARRFVTKYNRPWETRREAKVPEWCPLKVGK